MILTKSGSIAEVRESSSVTFTPAWNAVYGMALAVSGLITSEFLPVSLLSPMASDLKVTEGIAGQAISVTAVIAMVTSLLIAVITQRLNRRWVLLAFGVLQILSNLLVALAPSFTLLLAGRVLLGIGLGGFWSMVAATTMRLVPRASIAKALSIVYAAVSLATVVAAPMGSYLGVLIGWRNVFLVAAFLGTVAFIWQVLTLPSMPNNKPARLGTLLQIFKNRAFTQGTLATIFAFMAYATFFTYLRPFLETITGVKPQVLTIILLAFGLANFAGATVARFLLARSIFRTLVLMPLIMGIAAGGTVLFGHQVIIVATLISLWGAALGVIQLGWTAWLTQTVPDEAESAGGVQISAIQLAITAGAALGGISIDIIGASGAFAIGSIVAFIAAFSAILAFGKHLKTVPK